MQQDERVPQGVGDASESDAVTAQPERSVRLPCTPTIGEPAIYKVTQIHRRTNFAIVRPRRRAHGSAL